MSYYVIIGLIFVGIVIIVRSSLKAIGTPSKNNEERMGIIKLKVESIGGELIDFHQSKRKDCPFSNEINADDGSVNIFYKINYSIENDMKEGWAILSIQQSIDLSTGSQGKRWIWML